ncbi:hypothetical protein Cantr_01529 [Candida viswanathii]|uniref:Uncharacterized protein n=1 Tax=Candida viswanathii TaxID=5486 RepID=A0A367YL57_9ASCO|nr:hypothetical protein Cantr_01529 [Candida viswanathii]
MASGFKLIASFETTFAAISRDRTATTSTQGESTAADLDPVLAREANSLALPFSTQEIKKLKQLRQLQGSTGTLHNI